MSNSKYARRYGLMVFLAMLPACMAAAQHYSTAHVFAHNDYAGPHPFHAAYGLEVGYIEVDVFLDGNDLMVAHERDEITPGKTLEALYLSNLEEHVRRNNGFAYKDTTRSLTLMIDLKTPGVPTLTSIVASLEKFPALLSCQKLQIMISGNVPDPTPWKNFPSFISFDGRPGIEYTDEQLARISMISTNFRSHVQWNGQGKLPDQARAKMLQLIEAAHRKEKKIRFWATPDFENSWRELMRAQVDVIVTDKVPALVQFLREVE